MSTHQGSPNAPVSHGEVKKPRRIGLPHTSLDDTTLLALWIVVIVGMAALAAIGIFRLVY